MAWGFWNKLKKFGKDLWGGFKQGLGIGKKYILDPIKETAGNFVPGLKPALDLVGDGIDIIRGDRKIGAGDVKDYVNRGRQIFRR